MRFLSAAETAGEHLGKEGNRWSGGVRPTTH
jgi:hypothetical protein